MSEREQTATVVAGQIVISGKCAYRVLGPPELRPFACEDKDGQAITVDRYSLPVEPVTPVATPPSGGLWIDQSCFSSLPRFALIAESIEVADV